MQPRKKVILIVEDEQDIQDMYRKKLGGGYEIISATSGTEGLEKARESKPDLILLDIVLPMKEGFSVLEDLKKNPETAGIPVVILSNIDQDYEVKMAKDLGAAGYLTKTNNTPDQVAAAIGEILKENN